MKRFAIVARCLAWSIVVLKYDGKSQGRVWL